MKKEDLYEPFSVSVQVLEKYPVDKHKHSFFELVYVLSGAGEQRINENKFSYQAGDMFLLTPGDSHCFDIKETTTFFFLRFNNIYLKSSGIVKDNVNRLEHALMNVNQVPGSILKNESDQPFVRMVIDAMIREQVNRDLCWDKITLQLVNTLISYVCRNIEKYQPAEIKDDKEEKLFDILQYIQSNIYSPKSIMAESISEKFNLSVSYIGRYFKKNHGKTMQEYVSNYRAKMIENRLIHSNMRMSEIVGEFGFVDESHLNKFFKKHTGLTPSEFRKN